MFHRSRSARRLAFVGVVALVGVALAAPPAGAAKDSSAQKTSLIYSSIPNPLKGNAPSMAFEATSTTQFGDDATFRSGGRRLTAVTVGLSSWGCESGSWTTGDCVTTAGSTFSVPMTLTLYQVGAGGEPGDVIASTTQTFAVPYRPSSSPKCTGGRWYDSSLKDCFNGFATTVTFAFANLPVPDSLIWGIAYNTTHYGNAPIGESAACFTSSGGCGYDSLNVLTSESTIFGETSGMAYLDSDWAGAYCDGGATGTFRLDSPGYDTCWTGYTPAVAFKAAA